MTTVADLRVRFSADIGNAISGIRKVNDSIHRLQAGAYSALRGIDFGQMFNVAGGNLIANGIRNIASSVVGLGGEALSIYSDYERLTMSLETFAAQELIVAGGADNMSEALALSGERAQEVLGWIENLAVQSPFESTEISSAFRLAQAYGFTSDQAMRLTQATVDFATGAGFTGAMMDRISLALGQIQARGKVSAQELNQLSEAGINARSILANAFGVSTAKITEMIEKGLVPADLAVEALIQSLEKDFGGAAKRQANTFSGLISSLSDLKSIGLREFFRGTFEAIQPSLQRFVEFVTNPAVKENLRAWGDSIGNYIGGALAGLEERATRAYATFNLLSSQGDTVGGLLAGVGQFTGGDVTIDTAAKVTSVDWGIWAWTYDATSKILSVDWVGGLLGGVGGFTYDAAAKVLGVDWTSSLGDGGMGFTYDAEAGITGVHWNAEGFTYTYDADANVTKVNFAQGLFQGNYTSQAEVKSVLWGLYYGHYEADAGVTDVVWGVYTHTYQPGAEVTKVLWGAFTHKYIADTQVRSVLWGAWSHSYDATANVSEASVAWGAYSHQYDATVRIGETGILWGAYKHTYDAGAQVGEKSVLWGLWTWQYSATAGVTDVTFAGGALERAGAALSGLRVDLGSSLATAADSLGESLGAPAWVQDLINWKPSDGAPAWLEQLTIKAAPGLLTMLSNMVIKPPLLTDMGPLLTMTVPTLPANFWPALPTFSWPTLPSFSWPNYNPFKWPSFPSFHWPALPTFSWPTLPSFSWPSLPSFSWPNYNPFKWPSFPSFHWPAIPMPEWVSALINWRPMLPSWLGDGNEAPGQNASGTNSWRGGLTWIDERGPELFRFPDGQWAMGSSGGAHLANLPAGTEIYSHDDAKRMMSMAGLTPIGANADGTTSAPATWPGGGSTFAQNFEQRSADLGAKFAATGDKVANKIGRQMEAAAKKHRQELESALQSVPGLFGASQVTQQQMDMAALGVPQEFADDYVRQLTDEVVNKVDWANVDIRDAALRAGLDPSLPAEAILTMFKDAWADSSLFAGGKNLDLINQDAVQQALARQAASASGKDAINQLFGITPEQATGQAVALGTSMRSGIEQGLAQPTAGADSTGLLAGLATVTPEQFAPMGVSIVDGLATEVAKDEYKDKIGQAFTKLFTGFLERKEALTDVGAQIMTRISESLGNASGIDMIGKFATAFRAQLALPNAIEALHDIGARILEFVFQGYSDAAKERNWVGATVNVPANAPNPPPATASSSSVAATSTEPAGRSGMALAGAGGPTIVNNFYVTNEVDYNQAAYVIVDIIKRRGGRL